MAGTECAKWRGGAPLPTCNPHECLVKQFWDDALHASSAGATTASCCVGSISSTRGDVLDTLRAVPAADTSGTMGATTEVCQGCAEGDFFWVDTAGITAWPHLRLHIRQVGGDPTQAAGHAGHPGHCVSGANDARKSSWCPRLNSDATYRRQVARHEAVAEALVSAAPSLDRLL